MTPTRRRALAAIAGVLAIAATTSLGFWQLRRAATKEAMLARVVAAEAAPPVVPARDAWSHPEALVGRRLAIAGRWRPGGVVYLDNRQDQGRAGFYVLMPLALDAPAGVDVLVDRGWLPRDATDRTRIAPYATSDGPVALTGIALADEPRLLELGAAGARPLGGIWQNFDFAAYAAAASSRDDARPVRLVGRQDRDARVVDGLARDWSDRDGGLEAQIARHHGYALQWFAFAATFAALLVYTFVRHGRVRIR